MAELEGRRAAMVKNAMLTMMEGVAESGGTRLTLTSEKEIKKTFIKMKKGWLSELINTQQRFAMR